MCENKISLFSQKSIFYVPNLRLRAFLFACHRKTMLFHLVELDNCLTLHREIYICSFCLKFLYESTCFSRERPRIGLSRG